MIIQGYSAGRQGSDLEWETIGKAVIRYPNTVSFDQYYRYERTKRRHSGNKLVSPDDEAHAVNAVIRASKVLNRQVTFMKFATTYWMPVKEADEVFAIVDWVLKGVPSNICLGIDTPTQWAIQMAWDLGKKVHLFEQKTGHWREYNPDRGWLISETPMLTSKFAGIGVGRIEQNGRDAIAHIYRKSVQDWQVLQEQIRVA
jgi:hypothetical protein